jgi:two-component system, sensor histidine kinase
VIGYTSLFLDEDISSEHKELIEGIRSGGEAMMALITDILDFSRADKKKIELEHIPISLKHCVEESMDMVAPEANKKGLNLAYTVSYGTPDTIIGDHGRLRQILVNLLSNAVKFTDKGDVSVTVSSHVLEGNKCQLLFSIMDTGTGIPHEKLSTIFEPFTQLERTISRKREGVGLGLAITKNLVEMMDGTIWAESVPGQGTTLHASIQAETIPGKQMIAGDLDKNSVRKSVPGKKALRILVAEDNPSNQKVLVKMLKRMGYRPDAVADGLEAVQALKRQFYDLIFMGVRMPEMDGITATQVIRKLRPKDGPTIIAITAYALEGDREKCLEAGMDDYLSKPVQKNELEAILIKYSGGET